MKTTNRFRTALALIAVLTLASCANTAPYPPNPNVASSGNAYSIYGVVQSIELMRQDTAAASGNVGLGTLAGAVVGGVVGNQVGAGRGNTAATVIGAAGGAYVGHQMENRQPQQVDAYKITVRVDDGSYRAFTQSSNSGLQVGDRVRLDNGILQRY